VNERPTERITRRDAALRISATALAAAALGGGAAFFHDRRVLAAGAAAIPDWRTRGSGSSSPAVAARGGGPAGNVRRVIAALGGMERFVARGESVLIKPNVGWDRLPAQAANTDPQVVAELVRLCLAAGASRVVVSDNSCNDSGRCFARSGIGEAAAAAGARVVLAGQIRWMPAALTGIPSGLEVMDALVTADRVINVPVAKHHSLSRVTLGMKNWMGVLGRGRNRLHQDIDVAVAELGALFRPTLTVVDATRVLMHNGPTGGSLADVTALDAVAGSVDAVACDAWGAQQLGVDPRTLNFILEAERRGLGRGDVRVVRELRG
jgi:uncharacterized protein (DUF362 family)